MKFGLRTDIISKINSCFAEYPEIEKVIIYGSRAMGSYRNGSDIDLMIEDNGDFSFTQLLRLETKIDDLLLPWTMDISRKKDIENPELLEHIQRVGAIFYQKGMGLKTG